MAARSMIGMRGMRLPVPGVSEDTIARSPDAVPAMRSRLQQRRHVVDRQEADVLPAVDEEGGRGADLELVDRAPPRPFDPVEDPLVGEAGREALERKTLRLHGRE